MPNCKLLSGPRFELASSYRLSMESAMKQSLLIISTIACLFSTAFAQDPISRSSESKSEKKRLNSNFSLGFEYVNFSDSIIMIDASSTTESRSETLHQGGGLSMAGVSLGYQRIFDNSLGFSTNIRHYLSTQKSNNESNINLTVPEANLVYAFTEKFTSYLGANVGILSGTSYTGKMKPNVGFQFGLGYRISKQASLHLGSTTIHNTFSDSMTVTDSNGQVIAAANVNATLLTSGASAGFKYLF